MDNFKIIEEHKYGWDGEDYESESSARENLAKYNKDGFETQLIEEDGKYFVFTRRVITEIKIDGENA